MTTPITCLQCNGLLGPGDRFCAQCGAELLWCASCGEFLLQAEETCPKCGTPGIPRPDSHTVPYELPEQDSPWLEVIARLRRATFGEFEIGHELGRGGMAAVFLAHELSLHRDVAIKVMSPGLLMGDGMIERFRREAITIAHLNHPNIVSVYSVRAAEGLHFFVMRCIQGRSLEQVIKQAGKLPVPIVRSILHQVGSALAYAHRFKVIHRDIKPANILIDEEGNAVVTDFGIAKAAEGPSQTHSGFMVGTPAYMSPEQCSGGEVSGASDQYSLGVVAYEMITGVAPFVGSTYTVIQAHVERPPLPLREHNESCPPELESAILRMLAKNPEDRWPGMAQAMMAIGAAALAEDDPHRAELSRLASSGAPAAFGGGSQSSQRFADKSSTVLRVSAPDVMRAVTILPPPPGLEVGDSFLLVARVHDGQGGRLPGRPPEWSSDAPGILRVNPTKAVATAIAPGTALIRAVCEGKEGRLRVTVAPPRADSIVVKSLEKQVMIGDQIQLEATPRDKRGRVVTRPVTWRSENDSVATISLDGVLVAHSSGSTRITAELDEAQANVAVTVLPPPVAALHISSPPESVTAGDSFALTATPLDRWAGPLTGRTITWSVSDVSVALVTAGGWVITRNPGIAVLTATSEGIVATVSIRVVAAPVAAARAEPAARLTGSGADAEADPWEAQPEPRHVELRRSRSRSRWLVPVLGASLVAGGVWVAGGSRIADSPDSDTGILGRAPQTDSTSANDLGLRTATMTAPVGSGSPASVTITRHPAGALAVGGSSKLVAEVRDPDGRMVASPGVVWSTRDPAIAEVDSLTGALWAKGPGRTEVIAAVGAQRDSATILVRSREPGSPTGRATRVASLSIATHAPILAGDTTRLSLIALDRKGNQIRAPRPTWSSSDPHVAEVNPASGYIRARAAGTTLLIAKAGSESALLSLTVLPAAVATLRIEGAQPLKIGDTLTLRAELRNRVGELIDDRPVMWASTVPGVAQVDSSSGLVLAQGPGFTEIMARSGGKSDRVRVTVLPPPHTGRTEPPETEVAQRAGNTAPDPAMQQQRLVEQMLAGVEQCYEALRQKDVERVKEMYNSVTKSDLEKLKKLSRILETDEWQAELGERQDEARRIEGNRAMMDFSFRLSWKDAFGGRLTSHPVFRAEFTRNGNQLGFSSCRIVGSPKL